MKKKGLIISTVVMVVVLIASLTTATYAWFSSQAQAEIKNVSVYTQATDGLQVAVKTEKEGNTTGWVNGAITYENSQFGGDNDGWGTLADFAQLKENVGTLDNAVTLVKDADLTGTNKPFEGKLYKRADFATGVLEFDGDQMVVTADEAAQPGKVYYVADTTALKAGEYLVPIGYDGNIKPVAYERAVVNGTGEANTADYLWLPIGVRSSKAVSAIVCTLTVTPDTTNITNASFAPGMAAACYITMKYHVPGSATNEVKEITVEAYPSVTKAATGATGTGAKDTTWVYRFVVAGNGTTANVVEALTAYQIDYTIWIEGRDDMCDNLTAGSGFGVDIAYGYETAISNITVNAGAKTWTIAEGTSNAGTYNVIFA